MVDTLIQTKSTMH